MTVPVDLSEESLARHAALLPIATGARTARFMLAELRHRPRATAIMVGSTALFAVLTAVTPRLIGRIIDVVTGGGDRADVMLAAVWIGVVGLAAGAAGTWCWAQIAVLGQRILAAMREDVIDRALALPLEDMEKAGMGDALSRVADDVDVAARAFNNIVPNLLTSAFVVVFTFAGMGTIDLRLLAAGLLVLPIYVGAFRWYLPRSNRLYKRERIAMGDRAQALLAAVQGTATIHAYAQEQRQTDRVSRFSAVAYTITMRVIHLVGRVVGRFNAAEMLGMALTLTVAFALFAWDQITIGQATAGALYFNSLFWPLASLIFMLDDMQSAGASLARMVGVLDTGRVLTRRKTRGAGRRAPRDAAPRDAGPREVPPRDTRPRDASVRAVGVSHFYGRHDDGTERTVLHPTDLDIAEGETIALVGASGAGKSTLAAILAGTLAPAHGHVEYGSVPITALPTAARRAFSGILAQDAHVFRGTLAEDLRLARPGASAEDLRAALGAVSALGWVEALGKGLDEPVGEKGTQLTPEHAQHLALARAVLADPRVLVLDEATADAGSSASRILEDAALAAAAGRTCVVVAHRLSQAARADRIVVMDAGYIVEQGSHQQLLAADGAYARLWEAWSGT